MTTRIALLVIRGYQSLVSPLLGSHCRFHPTCSEYTYEAIRRFGLMQGCFLGFKRIVRCHPFHPGGFDPVPEARDG